MAVFVVDTNVAIVANGGDKTDTDYLCQLTCVERLEHLVKKGTVAVDTNGLILEEYADHLCWSGGPGVGDVFFKHVFTQYHDDKIRRVTVNSSPDDRKGFEELPENTFDRSDRKFLAVAVAAKAEVLNATDGDWGEHKALMDTMGVEVEQLCPQYLRTTRGGSG